MDSDCSCSININTVNKVANVLYLPLPILLISLKLEQPKQISLLYGLYPLACSITVTPKVLVKILLCSNG